MPVLLLCNFYKKLGKRNRFPPLNYILMKCKIIYPTPETQVLIMHCKHGNKWTLQRDVSIRVQVMFIFFCYLILLTNHLRESLTFEERNSPLPHYVKFFVQKMTCFISLDAWGYDAFITRLKGNQRGLMFLTRNSKELSSFMSCHKKMMLLFKSSIVNGY